METGTTTLIVLKELAGNSPPTLNTMQQFLAPHIESLTTAWFVVWVLTAIVVLAHAVREYRRRSKE